MRILFLAGLIGATACEGASAPSAGTSRGGENEVVARWTGGELRMRDLEQRLASDLSRMDIEYRLQRYEFMHRALDAIVDEAVLESERERLGLNSLDDLLKREVEDAVQEPDEEALRDAYRRFAPTVPEARFEEARPYLLEQLLDQARAERYQAYIAALKKRAGLHIDLPYPEIPRAGIEVLKTDPTLGPDDAQVTIIQFAEYQCYYCQKTVPTIDRIFESYEGKVRVVHKDFPLPGHDRARPAAIAAHCAGEQGKYWPMSRVLYQNQGELKDDHLVRYAADLGLDLLQWEACQQEPRWHRQIDESIQVGRAAGVAATPTFFINGLMVSGAQPYARFASIIDRELKP